MVVRDRIELSTFRFSGGRSLRLSYLTWTCGNALIELLRRIYRSEQMDAMIRDFSLSLASDGKKPKTIRT